MNRLNLAFALLLACFLGACSDDSIGSLQGEYDITRYVLNQVTDQSTDKLGKGIKSINVGMADDRGNTVRMSFGCSEWTLKAGVYALQTTGGKLADGMCSVALPGTTATGGSVEVQAIGGLYFINGLFTKADGGYAKCEYKGAITFQEGVDDPEASGYTVALATTPVMQTDPMGQPVGIVAGVSTYTFTISNPAGSVVATLAAINAENLTAEALAGTYTIAKGATEALQMAQGGALPAEWGGATWGSYFVAEGARQFITEGTVTIAVAQSAEGERLYSFAGAGLATTLGMNAADYSNIPGTSTTFEVRFARLSMPSSRAAAAGRVAEHSLTP